MDDLSEALRVIKLVVLDFDGVLTDNRVLVMEDGSEGVVCNRSDGIGIQAARELGIKFLVLSKEKNPVVQTRCSKLQLSCISGCDDKKSILSQHVVSVGCELNEVAYMGNDVNDIECLDMVGFPVAPADAWPEILEHVRFVTERPGGAGAVREFCDMVVRANRHVGESI